mgnify:FL=1
MEKLSGFVLSVLTVCVISGIVIGVSPEGAMKKYINYIISLCVLAAIITPIISIFSSVPQYSEDIERIFEEHKETDTDAEAKLIEAQKAAVETAIRDTIVKKFDIGEDRIFVEIAIDSTNKSAIEIRYIDISVKGKCHSGEIKKYIEEMFYGTAKVTVSEVSDGGA